MTDITETAPDGVAPFAGNITTQDKLADALRWAMENLDEGAYKGRHAGSYDAAIAALAAHDAQPAPAPVQVDYERQCDCPGGVKSDPLMHAPNCPVRTATQSAPGEAGMDTQSSLFELLALLDEACACGRNTPKRRIAVAKATVYLRDNADQVRLSIRAAQPPAPGEADEFDKPAMELTALRKKLAAAEDAAKSAGEACDDYEYMYQESRATQIRAAIAALQKATGNQGESA